MSKLKNVFPYTDLCSFAEERKLSFWNNTIDLLNEQWLPFYETSKFTIYHSDLDDENEIENPLMRQIFKEFFEKHNITDEINFIDS